MDIKRRQDLIIAAFCCSRCCCTCSCCCFRRPGCYGRWCRQSRSMSRCAPRNAATGSLTCRFGHHRPSRGKRRLNASGPGPDGQARDAPPGEDSEDRQRRVPAPQPGHSSPYRPCRQPWRPLPSRSDRSPRKGTGRRRSSPRRGHNPSLKELTTLSPATMARLERDWRKKLREGWKRATRSGSTPSRTC